MTPLAAFDKFVSDAERLGLVGKDATAEDVEALLDGVFGPGDEDDECGEDDYEDSGFDAFDDYEDDPGSLPEVADEDLDTEALS